MVSITTPDFIADRNAVYRRLLAESPVAWDERARAFLGRPLSYHLSQKHLPAVLDSFRWADTHPDQMEVFRKLALALPGTPVRTYRRIVGHKPLRKWLVLRHERTLWRGAPSHAVRER